MKKILLILFCAVIFIGCETTPTPVPEVIYLKETPKDPLPHPVMPILEVPDGDITLEQTMEYTLMLNGAIQKLQLLIEIYEREDRKLPEGYGNKKFAGMTLEELKNEYIKMLGINPTAISGGL